MKRFWDKVAVKDQDGCWEWVAAKYKSGRGQFNFNGKRSALAHRVAYELTYGEIPSGMCVCHRCDNPSCCNPNHLFLGTQLDNMADMWEKGRGNRKKGLGNKLFVLRESDIKEVKVLFYSEGLSQRSIGRKYNVSNHVIRRALRYDLC